MELNTKQELYNYLNNFNFDSVKDTKVSSVYFLVEFDEHIEPIYFTYYDGVWFESPCELHWCCLNDKDVMSFVKNIYYESCWYDAYMYEKTMQRNGKHYWIDCPQCTPFLPDIIKIEDVFSDSKCLDWMLDQINNEEG